RTRRPATPGTQADRARVLGWVVADRDRDARRHSAWNGQDAHAERAGSACGRAGGRAEMSRPPDFIELVGDDGSPEELERMRRVHELLVQAGPPAGPRAALPSERAQAPPPPPPAPVVPLARRRPGTAWGVAAAAVLAALVIGYAVGARGNKFNTAFSVPMHGVAPVAAARAVVKLGQIDAAGNGPGIFTVAGLPKLPAGGRDGLYPRK